MTRTEQVHRFRFQIASSAHVPEILGREIAVNVSALLEKCEHPDWTTLSVGVHHSDMRVGSYEIRADVVDTVVIFDVFEQLEIARLNIIGKAKRDADQIIADIDSGEYEKRIRKDALLAGMIADLERLDGKLQVMIGGVWMDVAKAVAAASVAFRSMAESLQSG